MGQLYLSRNPQTAFETGSWVEAIEDANNTMFTNINPYRNRLLMNKETAELVEQYQLQFISQKDLDSFLAQLQLRKETNQQHNNNVVLNRIDAEFRNSSYIYKIKYFQNLSVKELCTTIFHGRLYISKVDVRLKELNDIPFYDELYLYYACLSGFKILHEKVGVFQINEEMIFFDQQGQVRVWMNPNLSSFSPNYEPQEYNNEPVQNQGSQSEMLKNLMNIIEENTDQQSVGNHIQFKQYLIQKGLFQRLSFSKAIDYFGSYCEQNKFTVNHYMSSIYELFHQDEHMKGCVSQSSEVHKIFYNTHFELGKTNNEALTSSKANNHYNNSSPYGVHSQIQKREHQTRQRAFRSTNITPVNEQQTILSFNANQPNSISNLQTELSKIKYYQNGSSTLSYGQPKIAQPFYPHERKHKTQFTYQTASYLSPSLKNISEIRHRSNRKPQGDTKITFCYKPPLNVQKSKFAQPKNQFNSVPRNFYPPRKESIIDKLQTHVIQREIPKDEFKILSKNSIQQKARTTKDNSFNFYSANKEYALDKEIAEDLIKYLGFNPNI